MCAVFLDEPACSVFNLALDEIERQRDLISAYKNDFVLMEVNEMLKKTQARVQELEAERRWIPVSEKPKIVSNDGYSDDLLLLISRDVFTGYYKKGKWYIFDFHDKNESIVCTPNGWMYRTVLPKPPKESEG
jgi:hypothetical protein